MSEPSAEDVARVIALHVNECVCNGCRTKTERNIAAALAAARAEEREACCRDVCARCAAGYRLDDVGADHVLPATYPLSPLTRTECDAHAIRARGGKEAT